MIVTGNDSTKEFVITAYNLKYWLSGLLNPKDELDETLVTKLDITKEELKSALCLIWLFEDHTPNKPRFAPYLDNEKGFSITYIQNLIVNCDPLTTPQTRFMNQLYLLGGISTIEKFIGEYLCKDDRIKFLYSRKEKVEEWMSEEKKRLIEARNTSLFNDICIIC